LLSSGERRAAALAGALTRVRWMHDVDLAPFGDVEHVFTSVDSPEMLATLGGALP
jgi:hypothetical protein